MGEYVEKANLQSIESRVKIDTEKKEFFGNDYIMIIYSKKTFAKQNTLKLFFKTVQSKFYYIKQIATDLKSVNTIAGYKTLIEERSYWH